MDHWRLILRIVHTGYLTIPTSNQSCSEPSISLDSKNPLVFNTSSSTRHLSPRYHSPNPSAFHVLELFLNSLSTLFSLNFIWMIPGFIETFRFLIHLSFDTCKYKLIKQGRRQWNSNISSVHFLSPWRHRTYR